MLMLQDFSQRQSMYASASAGDPLRRSISPVGFAAQTLRSSKNDRPRSCRNPASVSVTMGPTIMSPRSRDGAILIARGAGDLFRGLSYGDDCAELGIRVRSRNGVRLYPGSEPGEYRSGKVPTVRSGARRLRSCMASILVQANRGRLSGVGINAIGPNVSMQDGSAVNVFRRKR